MYLYHNTLTYFQLESVFVWVQIPLNLNNTFITMTYSKTRYTRLLSTHESNCTTKRLPIFPFLNPGQSCTNRI